MSVHGKQDGKTNAAASLNHEADLSDSELDAVVGGHGLSLSGLKKGFEDLGHKVEAAASTVANEASQSFHGAQNAASGVETTLKHGNADAGHGLQSLVETAIHNTQSELSHLKPTGSDLSKIMQEEEHGLKHFGKDFAKGLHENEHGLKDLEKEFAKGLHENEHGLKDLEKEFARGLHENEHGLRDLGKDLAKGLQEEGNVLNHGKTEISKTVPNIENAIKQGNTEISKRLLEAEDMLKHAKDNHENNEVKHPTFVEKLHTTGA